MGGFFFSPFFFKPSFFACARKEEKEKGEKKKKDLRLVCPRVVGYFFLFGEKRRKNLKEGEGEKKRKKEMALNPPIDQNTGVPLAITGEHFIMMRSGISFRVDIDDLGELSGKGVIFLTTLRIVFVNTSPSRPRELDGRSFNSFDIPLAYLSNENFNQPILGANNLTAMVAPITELGLTGMSTFKISFNEGGCGTFLPIFIALVQNIRQITATRTYNDFVQTVESGSFRSQAYVDPSDPTVIYVTQPTEAQPTQSVAYPGISGSNYPIPGEHVPTVARATNSAITASSACSVM